ncbi:MAG: CCA tRNA nucleotidyltransferase [Hymenobacteraceae bacterium]|nr:CCA tRNA nucleotidyltransferase [Hymenobacteraceae bacterium]MDX5395160.1 CCA tRNA nucleotidyltransferase [Hymenobacteraceae bacterium]MDX5444025.1 CCA tRNA nucleotidyltransferase [Hymenobacteraceae bacterium]MDX5511197.1 CCA tRNA nucleotidyltransferase [Hymenobacteraceae bacterium]
MNKPELPDHKIFKIIAETASELGVESYVIGGFVRDIVLGRPSKDIDVVCVGNGIELAEAVAKRLPHKPKVAVFKNFGTAALHEGEWDVEFVGARKESYRSHSRKPEVETGTLEDDLIRRDFTINALGISLNKENFGELIDRFGGMQDIKKKIIRTPTDPNITFSDDPLRMMRAIRFATQLNFDIDPDTFDAIIDNKERIKIVSQERVTDELNKIILAKTPSYGFKLLFHTGLLHLIFPKMVELHGVETINKKSHKDNFYHTLQVLDNVAEVSDDLWLRWSAILHDIAKPDTKRFHEKHGWTFHGHEDRGARMVPKIFKDLKLPLSEPMRKVQKLVRLHLRPIALVKETVTDSAIRRLLFEAGDDSDDLMKLCRADITSKDSNRVKRYLQNFNKVEQRMHEVEELDKLRNFQPVITGDIIMQTFGLKPSKEVGELKELLTEAILEGEIRNEYNEAFAYLLQKGKERGLQPVQ